mgnify:CR=1 FL=1
MLPSGPGRNANTAWPHAFDAEGMPLPAPERARLKAELKGAGRIREHWRGNLHHVDLEPFQERIRSIPTRRGDLLIWHRGCPHGNPHEILLEHAEMPNQAALLRSSQEVNDMFNSIQF